MIIIPKSDRLFSSRRVGLPNRIRNPRPAHRATPYETEYRCPISSFNERFTHLASRCSAEAPPQVRTISVSQRPGISSMRVDARHRTTHVRPPRNFKLSPLHGKSPDRSLR